MNSAWFASQTGRRVSKAVIYAAASGGFLMYYLPNTLLIDKYKSITHHYSNGRRVQLSEKIYPLVEEVTSDLQLSKEQKDMLSLYSGYGFNFFRSGSLSLISSKVVLGIPYNFKYGSVQEFDPTGIAIKDDQVAWSLPEAQALQKSLILSRDAKKFAIAREMILANSAQPFISGVYASSVILMCYHLSSYVNSRINLYAKERNLRMILYCVVSLFSYTVWCMGKDLMTVSYETKADETAASISENYARGGLEFYEKTLQRNKALRSLMGSEGEAMFTSYGNEPVFIRTKHLPITVCKEKMKAKVDEYKKLQEGSLESSHQEETT